VGKRSCLIIKAFSLDEFGAQAEKPGSGKKNCPVFTEQLFKEFGNLTGFAVTRKALFILLKTF
jgi:hypothetical protein